MNGVKKLDVKNTVIMIIIILLMAFGLIYYMFYLSDVEESTQGVMIVDDFERNVTVPKNPYRIVSLAPSTTEILFAIGAGERVVGVDQYSNFPEDVKNIPKIGSFVEPDLERIVSLRPDFVLGSDMVSSEAAKSMEERGLALVLLAPKTLDDVMRNIELVGLMTDKVDEAIGLVNSLRQRVDAITSKTNNSVLHRPRVYMEYFPYWTYGPGSFGNELISLAGGENIAVTAAGSYAEITNEFVVSNDPEIIVYTFGAHTTTTSEEIKNRPGWAGLEAVKKDQIYVIDDDLISRPGPRIIVALEELACIIHPELFS